MWPLPLLGIDGAAYRVAVSQCVMATWRNSPELTNTQRVLVREGLYAEIAPGRVVPADLAGEPSLRAQQRAPYIPRGHVAVTCSACWIYTGWWPPGRMREVFAAHPKRTKPPAMYRHAVPEAFSKRIGDLTVTTPARTAIDLLLLEPLDQAMDGLFQLHGAHVTTAELLGQVNLEYRRKRLPLVREIIGQFADYIEWRDTVFEEAIRSLHAQAAGGDTGGATGPPCDDHPSWNL